MLAFTEPKHTAIITDDTSEIVGLFAVKNVIAEAINNTAPIRADLTNHSRFNTNTNAADEIRLIICSSFRDCSPYTATVWCDTVHHVVKTITYA